ncbi:unnamed protein product [Ectocarpus sp. 6 AP-2014]
MLSSILLMPVLPSVGLFLGGGGPGPGGDAVAVTQRSSENMIHALKRKLIRPMVSQRSSPVRFGRGGWSSVAPTYCERFGCGGNIIGSANGRHCLPQACLRVIFFLTNDLPCKHT